MVKLRNDLIEAALDPRIPPEMKAQLIQIAKHEAEAEVRQLAELEALVSQFSSNELKSKQKPNNEKEIPKYDDLGDD